MADEDTETSQHRVDRLNREAKDRWLTAHPGNWLQQWFRDKAFWREVAASSIAGLIVAFLIFFVVVLIGLIKPWVIAAVITLIILVLAFAFSGYNLSEATDYTTRKVNRKLFFRYQLKTQSIMIGLLVVIWVAAWLVGLVWH
jgi:Ca2+/Na+ antiporter